MPAARLKVSLEIPAFDQGEIAENPIPAQKANSNSVRAAVATPPAAMAAQDTADRFSSTAPARSSVLKLSVMAMVLMLKAASEQHSDGRKSSGSASRARANSRYYKVSNDAEETSLTARRAAAQACDRCALTFAATVFSCAPSWRRAFPETP